MQTIDRYLLTFLLNALWQAPLAAAIAAVACRFMRNGPAQRRHIVCAAALLTAVLLPAASVRRRSAQPQSIAVPSAMVPAATAAQTSSLPPERQPTPAHRTIHLPSGTAWILTGSYLLLIAYRAIRLLIQSIRTRRIVAAAEPCASPATMAVWSRCSAVMNTTHGRLRCSNAIAGPVTAGTTVILPISMLEETSETVLTTAIGHELAHIRRRDFPCNLFYELLSLPIWFHPATAWLKRQIDRTRELACDELVTERLLDPETYAQSIVTIAAGVSNLRQPEYTLGVLDGDVLQERIERLLHRPPDARRGRVAAIAAIAALAICVVAASSLAISARAQSVAQPEMKLAGEAYNRGDFAGAVSHFENAVSLDPSNANARLFLANAYIRLHLADRKADAASLFLNKARDQYRETAKRDPKNVSAMVGLASMLGMEHAQEAHELLLKAIEIDPRNANAYYGAGVADWQIAFAPLREYRGTGPQMYDLIPDAAVRAKLAGQMLPVIEEGIRMLRIALDLNPQSSDAMAYMNLLLRLKAPLAGTAAERDSLIAEADQWVGKALEAIRANPRQRQARPIDVDQPPPQAIPAMVPAPPPPPPPPPAGGFRGNGDRPR